MKKGVKLIIIFSLIFFIAIGIILGIGSNNQGYKLYYGNRSQVNTSSDCQEVINAHASNSYFIPTKTSTEWSSFKAHLPAGVTIDACNTLPPRIAVKSGYNPKYTDANGVWQTDCSSTPLPNNVTFCLSKNPESYTASVYTVETIYNWESYPGCTMPLYAPEGVKVWTRRCNLCTELIGESSCISQGCYFHNFNLGCGRYNCYSYSTMATCQAAGCYWAGLCYGGQYCNQLSDDECAVEETYYDGYCCWDGYSCNPGGMC